MKSKWLLILCLAFTICLVGISGCKKKGGVKTLKLGHSLPEDHPVHVAMEFMANQLEEKSGGKMTIKIYPTEQLGSERVMIEQVQQGLLDMCKTSTSPLESFVPDMAVYSVPYIFNDRDHYWNVLKGSVGEDLKMTCESKNMIALCYYDSGSRSFYTKDKPILKPEDLAGLKIRVMESKTSKEMVKALGGSPTSIPWGELYTSLQQGVVDGAENNPPSLYVSRQYEVCKHYSLDEHTMIPDIVLISKKTWEELSDQEKQWIQEAANESREKQIELWTEFTKKSMDEVQKAGVKVYHPEKALFREKVKAMHQSYDGTKIGEYIKRIQEVE